jgi:hypothetical protein
MKRQRNFLTTEKGEGGNVNHGGRGGHGVRDGHDEKQRRKALKCSQFNRPRIPVIPAKAGIQRVPSGAKRRKPNLPLEGCVAPKA